MSHLAQLAQITQLSFHPPDQMTQPSYLAQLTRITQAFNLALLAQITQMSYLTQSAQFIQLSHLTLLSLTGSNHKMS